MSWTHARTQLEKEIRQALAGLPARTIDDAVAALMDQTLDISVRLRPKKIEANEPQPEVEGDELF